jgi:uncharacterized membrane protein YdjX (TVP38/TMEM64 family)
LTFETVSTYKTLIEDWTAAHYVTAVCLYLVIFILLIACTIPAATFLTIFGGFLFGFPAFVYSMLGTTLGGLLLCLAVRTSIGDRIARQKTGWLKTMERGFQDNGFYYILSLRLMPVFPCWISNISAGALNVPIRIFVAATLIGIAPATFIYTMIGRGLDKFLSNKNGPDVNLIFTPSIFFPLLGLAILSILPVLYKKIKKRQ